MGELPLWVVIGHGVVLLQAMILALAGAPLLWLAASTAGVLVVLGLLAIYRRYGRSSEQVFRTE